MPRLRKTRTGNWTAAVSILALLPSLLFLEDGGEGGGEGAAGGEGGEGGDGDLGDLGDGGKKAIAAERAAAKEAEKARKAAEKRASDLEERLAKIDEANQTESEKALEKARKEAAEAARVEVLATSNERLLKAEVRAAAGGKLADPEDAVRLLDLGDFSVGDDGDVDRTPIDKAITDLLETKPYLAANGHTPSGDLDQGGRGGEGPKPEVKPGLGRLRYAYSQGSTK